jgi:hypothetical protein
MARVVFIPVFEEVPPKKNIFLNLLTIYSRDIIMPVCIPILDSFRHRPQYIYTPNPGLSFSQSTLELSKSNQRGGPK